MQFPTVFSTKITRFNCSTIKSSSEQVSIERKRLMELLNNQILVLGKTNISNDLLQAIESGEIETDITRKYI